MIILTLEVNHEEKSLIPHILAIDEADTLNAYYHLLGCQWSTWFLLTWTDIPTTWHAMMKDCSESRCFQRFTSARNRCFSAISLS